MYRVSVAKVVVLGFVVLAVAGSAWAGGPWVAKAVGGGMIDEVNGLPPCEESDDTEGRDCWNFGFNVKLRADGLVKGQAEVRSRDFRFAHAELDCLLPVGDGMVLFSGPVLSTDEEEVGRIPGTLIGLAIDNGEGSLSNPDQVGFIAIELPLDDACHVLQDAALEYFLDDTKRALFDLEIGNIQVKAEE